MTISLRVGGTDFSIWTDVEITRSMDAASGTFSFTSASDEYNFLPVKAGDPVSVVINNKTVISGFVDRVEVAYDAYNHVIRVSGRDKTSDVIDSKVDHEIEFQAPITLESVAEQVLSNIGASSVKVVSEVGDIPPFVKGELLSASIGQTAFDFIESYARKRQILITTNGKGDLVLTRAKESSTALEFRNIVGGNANNIKSAEVSYDHSRRYSDYKLYSQGNPGGDPYANESSTQLTDRTSTFSDSEVRGSRKYSNLAESSSKEETLEERVRWEGEIRKAKSFSYKCTVVGFGPSKDGAPYSPNSMARVADDFAGVHRELLITDVTYNLSVREGSTTSLTLIPKEAYSKLKSTDQFQPKEGRESLRQQVRERESAEEIENLWNTNNKNN
jgi:prophage tail gpP-like protein